MKLNSNFLESDIEPRDRQEESGWKSVIVS